MKHDLKILPQYFSRVADRSKTFEIRLDDRGYQAGDVVVLKEWDDVNLFSGREITAKIGFVTSYEQKAGYVVFSLLFSSDEDWSKCQKTQQESGGSYAKTCEICGLSGTGCRRPY